MKSLAVRSSFLPFSPPAIGEAERTAVLEALCSEWISTGPRTRAFEQELQALVRAPATVAFNSCTAGLHVALVALGVGPGDEVLVPTMTFCATANVVEHVGARPVLVDVCPDTLNLDPGALERAITPRSKAVIPVHLAGHPADLDPLFALAKAHALHLVEDAAHALPASYKGVPVGSRDNLAAFSFYATKNITTSEGGALTGAPSLVDRCRILGHHGMNRDAWKRFDRSGSWYYEVVLPGFKYNMTDLQAALGSCQVKRLAAFQRRRKAVVAAYTEGFQDLPELELPVLRPEVESSLHLYILRLRLERLAISRAEFLDELKACNIGASVHYLPVHMHPFYRDRYGLAPEACPVAAAAYDRIVSLPLHPGLTPQDVDDVILAVRSIVERHRQAL